MARFFLNESGSVPMMFGLSLVPMIVGAGMAVEYSNISTTKTRLQAAIDTAVLAAAKLPVDARDSEAVRFFKANYAEPTTGLTFTTDSSGNFKGTANASVPKSFTNLLPTSSQAITVSAQARPATAQVGPVCFLVLDPVGSAALTVNAGALINAPHCEMHVKSTSNPAAVFNSTTTFNFYRTCIQSAHATVNASTVNNLVKNCPTATDPYEGNIPTPASSVCDFTGVVYNALNSVTLNPGVYCGNTVFNAVNTITFNPGTYVIKGGNWTFNTGILKGSGVSFYFADSSRMVFNAVTEADLTAPVNGAYKGFLFLEAPGLAKTNLVFNAATKTKMEGIVYLPSRNLTLNSTNILAEAKTNFVVNRAVMNSFNMNLTANSDLPIAAPNAAGGAGGLKLTQ
jgi:Flp pilus assembly protein TadG